MVRAVNWAISDKKHFDLVVYLVMDLSEPDAVETEEGKAFSWSSSGS